jgi:hypothetical protein
LIAATANQEAAIEADLTAHLDPPPKGGPVSLEIRLARYDYLYVEKLAILTKYRLAVTEILTPAQRDRLERRYLEWFRDIRIDYLRRTITAPQWEQVDGLYGAAIGKLSDSEPTFSVAIELARGIDKQVYDRVLTPAQRAKFDAFRP